MGFRPAAAPSAIALAIIVVIGSIMPPHQCKSSMSMLKRAVSVQDPACVPERSPDDRWLILIQPLPTCLDCLAVRPSDRDDRAVPIQAVRCSSLCQNLALTL